MVQLLSTPLANDESPNAKWDRILMFSSFNKGMQIIITLPIIKYNSFIDIKGCIILKECQNTHFSSLDLDVI